MEGRTIFAIILVIGILLFWNTFIVQRPQPPSPVEPQDPIRMEEEIPKNEVFITYEETRPVHAGKLDTIETSLVRAVFSNVGGSLIEYTLKEFSHHKDSLVQLIPHGQRALTDIIVVDGKTYNLRDSIFCLKEIDENSISYSISLQGIGEIVKRYEFAEDYIVFLDISLPHLESYNLVWDGGLSFTERNNQDETRFFSAVALTDGGLITTPVANISYEGERIPTTALNWVGIKNKYFLASIIPDDDIEATAIKMRRFSKTPPGGGCMPRGCGPSMGGGALNPADVRIGISLSTRPESIMRFLVYIGPLDYKLLASKNVGLEQACYMGWRFFRPISRAILFVIMFFSRFIPNYGFVLILFALLMTFIFYPVTVFNQKTMRKTADLQPKLRALQKKCKKDPQRLNKETMALYKKSGVNPISGCLPMLLQMPIFIALWAVLQSTIALRGADFVGWINDLSQPDPFFVLPILMGITMFLQQRLMGTQAMAQDSQKMMTYMMPIVLTFMFLSFPAGIVLYWFSFNLFNIAQLLYLKRKRQPVTG